MRRTAKNAGAAGELRLHCFSRRPASPLPAARDRAAPATELPPRSGHPAAYPRGKTRTPPPREPRDRAPPAHRALPSSRSQGARGRTGLSLRHGHPRRSSRRHRRPACRHRREGARPRHRPGRTHLAPRPRRPAPRHPPRAAHTGSGRAPRPSGDLLAVRHPGGPGRSRPGSLGSGGHPARPAAPHPRSGRAPGDARSRQGGPRGGPPPRGRTAPGRRPRPGRLARAAGLGPGRSPHARHHHPLPRRPPPRPASSAIRHPTGPGV